MKKIYLLLSLALMSGCSKESSQSTNTTIIYQLNVKTSGTFDISYTNANNDPVNLVFTGTSWSQTITTSKSMGFKTAYLTITDPSASNEMGIVETGTATIEVNGNSSDQMAINFGNGVSDVTFYDSLF